MSEDNSSQRPKSKIAYATIRMPDGKEHEIPLAPKTFSSGREGYYSQVPSFVYDNEVYGGQIQIWKKVKKVKELDFNCKLGNASEMTSANFQSCCKKSAQLISKVALFPTHQTEF